VVVPFAGLVRLGLAGALLAVIGWMVSGFFFYVFPGEGDGPVGSLPWWLVGFPLLGIATFRSGVLPRWCGLLLVVYFPVLFVLLSLFSTGVIWNGLVWLALGYALWTRRGMAAEQP
jgi:hypothetical protein